MQWLSFVPGFLGKIFPQQQRVGYFVAHSCTLVSHIPATYLQRFAAVAAVQGTHTQPILSYTIMEDDVLAASPDHVSQHTATSFGLASPERCQSPGAPTQKPDNAVVAQYEARLAAKHHELLQLKRRVQVTGPHAHHHKALVINIYRCSPAATAKHRLKHSP